MDTPIYTRADLRNEIFRLQGLEHEKSIALKQRFSNPMAVFSSVFSSVFSFFSGRSAATKDDGIFGQDFVGVISRVLLPLTLNKTIFKHSGFLVKTLVGLASQKVSHYISEDSVSNVWDKAKELFVKFIKKDH